MIPLFSSSSQPASGNDEGLRRASTSRVRAALNLVLAVVLLLLPVIHSPALGAEPDIVIWGHSACPHCRAAYVFLDDLQSRRPDLQIVRHDVRRSPAAHEELSVRAREAGFEAAGIPSFVVHGQFLVGFDSAETTGTQIESLLVKEEPPPPAEGSIELPVLGRVNVGDLGLPLFTLAIGLVDGFNPCAMWVLLFLLSLLVNIKSRARMAAIAGTFVLVSGVAYYAFMAAWLNVFNLVGMSRAVQIVLGTVALLIGTVNVKDFFAFQKGLSLGIPERAKPGIYARVRSIVRAERLGPAIVGATTLAVLVNVIELVCTAGLPALYTQVLVQQDVSTAGRYGYLALYNLAYMLDDSILVAIFVITLGKRKLQENEGRWLKLLSGAVILLLGLLLIFAPQALSW